MKLQKTNKKFIKFIVSLILAIIVIWQFSQQQIITEAKNIKQEKKDLSYFGLYISKNQEQEEKFNLALRKVILSIKDQEGNNKNIVNENKENATRSFKITQEKDNIKYQHRKDPVLVEKGDIIIYAITICNEGEQPGYAKKIVDQLPGTSTTGLRLLTTNEVTSSTENKYSVEYSTTTNTVTFIQKSTNPKTIPSFNGKTLSQETILLECQVMADIDTKQETILTNIAYISEKYNSETKEVIKRREYPKYQNEHDTKQDGITYGDDIGYIGNINNQEDLKQHNVYYKGQEIDDDFEKLVILPKEFDLSLRTVITGVDGAFTKDREITIENLEALKAEEPITTTAQYNHIKKPIEVKKGSIVTYNINIYNEASLDGLATIVKHQLPNGVKLDLSSLYTQLIDGKTQYYIITKKGNKYIVQYDENANIITFRLDETSKVINIEAFTKRETLDFDTLEFDCIVDYVADEKSNIYLTSISYIDEEKKTDGTRITNQNGEDRDSEPYTRPNYTANQLNTLNYIGYTGELGNPTDLGQKNTYYKGEQDDNDFEKLVILPQAFDLKLVTYVDEINGETAGKRIIKVDTSKLNTEENGRKIRTAEYEMEKNPVSVKALDLVKYTFRIYNEGDYDGYVTEIAQNIPEGLEALMIGKDIENGIIIYSWDGANLEDITEQIKETEKYNEIIETNSIWGYSAEEPIIKTTSLKDEVIKAYGKEEYTNYADKENGIDYKEVSVIFRVKENIMANNTPIRSEAAITGSKCVNEEGEEIINTRGESIQDRDCKNTEWSKRDSGKDYNSDKWEIYKEDDEDYENIIVREFDLSLRKQVTKITRNGQDINYTDRYAKLDTEAIARIEQRRIEKQKLEELEKQKMEENNALNRDNIQNIQKNNVINAENMQEGNTIEQQQLIINELEETKEKTIYTYYDVYNNKPKVRVGDIVTYSIRVYNEGEVSAYASLITETLPSGLEIVEYTEGDGSINDKYKWKLVEGTTNIYATDYLSYEKDEDKGNGDSKIIKGCEETKEAFYKEVEIQCKVKDNATKEDSLLSISQIADDSDDKGNPVKDKDSNTGKEDDERNWKNEDDLDIEILQLEEFDLELRKFISEIEKATINKDSIKKDKETIECMKVIESEIKNRIPEVEYDKDEKKVTYTKNKEPQAVNVGDTVIYSIRIYNNGDIDGYAKQITEYISEDLDFLPEHEINKQYEWKMYDKRGKETENAERTVKIETNYLAKEENTNSSSNIIKAFRDENGNRRTNPDYKEIKVALKVKDTNSSEHIIESSAQISKVTDEKGSEIKDKDEIAYNNEEEHKKNNKDTEKLEVQFFDLSLTEYLEKIIIVEDEKREVIETGNTGSNGDIIAKVEINKNKIKQTIVKFIYKIKITNEGDIEGSAKKITDYVPEGLEFKVEDNPNWTDEGNGTISTNLLENLLIQPGESREIDVILTWKNQKNNLGTKINMVEIAEDYNAYEVPDKDSIPNNKDKKEDDIGRAEVIVAIIGMGINPLYINLVLILSTIVLVGIILIKVFILRD